MSVDVFMRELRENRSMTQKEFAEFLGVSVPTISRIEVGGQTTLSPRMASKLASILSDEEASRLNPLDAQEHKIAVYYSHHGNDFDSFVISPVCRLSFTEGEWTHDILSKLSGMVATIGFDFENDCNGSSVYYRNSSTQKTWQVLRYMDDCCDGYSSILGYIALKIGQAFLIEKSLPNKISILTQNTADEIKDKIGKHIPRYLPFDLSFLHYSDDGLIYSETDLVLNTDGHGIFDLESEDAAAKANAAMDFAKWKTSFFKAD